MLRRLCHRLYLTHHHSLSFCGTGEVIWGTYCVLCRVLTLCVCVCGTFAVHTGGVGRLGTESQIPEESLGSREPVLLSSQPMLGCWGDRKNGRREGREWEQMSRRGGGPALAPFTDRIWSMSCRQGSRPSLRTQTYLQCICRAACAVRLSPLRAVSVFLLGVRVEDGGRIAGGREKLMAGRGSMWNCPR